MSTLKYFPRLNLYKASNVTFDPATCQGYSYKWYRLVDKIGDTIVLNSYAYSNTTIKHIYKMRRLLESLGLQYVEIEAPKGLQDLDRAAEYYRVCNKILLEQINKPRSKASKNNERRHEISKNGNKLVLINQLKEIRGY